MAVNLIYYTFKQTQRDHSGKQIPAPPNANSVSSAVHLSGVFRIPLIFSVLY